VASEEHREEVFQLVKGSPQPELGTTGLAERTGLSEADVGAVVDELVAEGRLRREGDRLIAVEATGRD
jgi:DNA-binding IclR family transcriptional regulator